MVDLSYNPLRFELDLLACEAQDAYALGLHKAITGFSVKSTLFSEVIASINFNDESFFSAIEFDCIDALGMLPGNFLLHRRRLRSNCHSNSPGPSPRSTEVSMNCPSTRVPGRGSKTILSCESQISNLRSQIGNLANSYYL